MWQGVVRLSISPVRRAPGGLCPPELRKVGRKSLPARIAIFFFPKPRRGDENRIATPGYMRWDGRELGVRLNVPNTSQDALGSDSQGGPHNIKRDVKGEIGQSARRTEGPPGTYPAAHFGEGMERLPPACRPAVRHLKRRRKERGSGRTWRVAAGQGRR